MNITLKPETKRRIAKEWKWLVVCQIVGIVWWKFFNHDGYIPELWVCLAVPIAIIYFIRITKWAITTLRHPTTANTYEGGKV